MAMGLSAGEAAAALEGAELVPALQAGLTEAKTIIDELLAVGVPAILGRDNHCTKGCAPKLFVLVKSEDVPRLAELVHARHREALVKVGVDPASIAIGIEADGDENPPCPACGSTGDLIEGACPECGLQLG
jgi:hypothetical protein